MELAGAGVRSFVPEGESGGGTLPVASVDAGRGDFWETRVVTRPAGEASRGWGQPALFVGR